MNKDKVYVQGYVVGFSADAMGYKGLRIQLPNMDIVEIDENLVYRNIDEQQKPVVPQFVADWIEYCKNMCLSLVRALMVEEIDFYNYANQEDLSRLTDFFSDGKNQDIFARAWLGGYRVEKEKRYLVKMKGMVKNDRYLKYDKNISHWYFSGPSEYDEYRLKHTRKELEEAGFGWIFSCEGIEVEEVE